jgi:phosphate transport system substrate-binding protein
MAQKNEAPALLLSLLLTLGLIAGGLWWLTQRSGGNLTQVFGADSNSTPSASPNLPPASTASPNQSSARSSSAQAATTFADVENVPSGLFNYGGSTTWAPVRGQVDPAIQQAWSSFQLRYTEPITGTPGSSAGIRMLLANQLTFAQSSRSLSAEEYQEAQQRGFTLQEIPVAIEGIAVAVHPSLEVAGLTLDQLKGIYTGQFTNWEQVGGPNLPITPYSRRLEDGGTVDFFVENVLGEESFSGGVTFVTNTTAALQQLSADTGGIYYASAPEIVGQCTIKPIALGRRSNELIVPYQSPLIPASQCPAQRNRINLEALRTGQYPLTRRLFVVVKQNGQVDQAAGEAYANLLLTNQGQTLLNQAGFVPIQ